MTRFCVLFVVGLALSGVRLVLPAGADPLPASEASGSVTVAQMQAAFPDPPRILPRPRPGDRPLGRIALAPDRSLRPRMRDSWDIPRLRWDAHPRGPRWSAAVMSALRGPGAPLLDVVPRDIAEWCPAYPGGDPEQRAAFWAGLVSTLAWHESTHDPRAVGGDGRWFGLVQIAPGTAQWRNCQVGTGEALLDGPANLRCGIRIMAVTVPRDGVIAEGMRGVAADWGPFHSRRKREDMRNWVRGQDYCRLPLRPVMRPDNAPSAPGRMAQPLRPRPGPPEARQIAAR